MDHPVRPERPSFFADRPARPRGDLLSALLRSVRLRGEDISGFVGVPRVAYEGNAGALHLIEEGTAWLELRPGEPEVLQTGDLALIANGASHHVAAKSANARWITGTFEFDQLPRNALIDGLPALVVLRNPEVSGLEWFDVSRRLLLKERDTPTQGSSVMISRILDLMFVQILRAWAVGPQAEAGWLQAGLDADISRALDAIHAHPGRPWTTASLATEANLSRSSFVVRFRSVHGRTTHGVPHPDPDGDGSCTSARHEHNCATGSDRGGIWVGGRIHPRLRPGTRAATLSLASVSGCRMNAIMNADEPHTRQMRSTAAARVRPTSNIGRRQPRLASSPRRLDTRAA